jgi:hypothetical protein
MGTEVRNDGDQVAEDHGSAAEADLWRIWATEIFADIFSVLVMGQWALWALVEVAARARGTMLTRQRYYPAPVVRLELMAQVLKDRRIALDANEGLHGLKPKELAAGNALMERDLALVPYVVARATQRVLRAAAMWPPPIG